MAILKNPPTVDPYAEIDKQIQEEENKPNTLFFEKGLLNIPVYAEYENRKVSAVSRKDGELAIELEQECWSTIPVKVTNEVIKGLESYRCPTTVIELHLPDFCRVGSRYLIERVEGDFSIPIGEALSGKTEADLLSLSETPYSSLGIFDSMSLFAVLLIAVALLLPIFLLRGLFTSPGLALIGVGLLIACLYIFYLCIERIAFEVFLINLPG